MRSEIWIWRKGILDSETGLNSEPRSEAGLFHFTYFDEEIEFARIATHSNHVRPCLYGRDDFKIDFLGLEVAHTIWALIMLEWEPFPVELRLNQTRALSLESRAKNIWEEKIGERSILFSVGRSAESAAGVSASKVLVFNRAICLNMEMWKNWAKIGLC